MWAHPTNWSDKSYSLTTAPSPPCWQEGKCMHIWTFVGGPVWRGMTGFQLTQNSMSLYSSFLSTGFQLLLTSNSKPCCLQNRNKKWPLPAWYLSSRSALPPTCRALPTKGVWSSHLQGPQSLNKVFSSVVHQSWNESLNHSIHRVPFSALKKKLKTKLFHDHLPT